MEFDYFFQTAFEESGFDNVGGQLQGKSYEEIMGAVEGAHHWTGTLIKALKAWENAMREKSKLNEKEKIMYSIVAADSNFFLYVYAIEKGKNGEPVITQQMGRFDFNEYMGKLKDGIRFAEPYLKAAETIAPKLLGHG